MNWKWLYGPEKFPCFQETGAKSRSPLVRFIQDFSRSPRFVALSFASSSITLFMLSVSVPVATPSEPTSAESSVEVRQHTVSPTHDSLDADACAGVPHSWLCDGRLLRLHDPRAPGNMKAFESRWKKGEVPVSVCIGRAVLHTLFQNGRHFSFLLFSCKLALVASTVNSKFKKTFSRL